MKTFSMYRRGDLSATHDENQANGPDEVQFQGVIFDNGQCVIRWLTQKGSVSVWDSFEDMMAIHGHPEYDSEIVWDRHEDGLKSVVAAFQDGRGSEYVCQNANHGHAWGIAIACLKGEDWI